MTAIRAELHSHSTFSDGELSPQVLAGHLQEAGVQVWSLTDHDSCAGCGIARQAAEEHGITFVDGLEISAYQGRSVHVLGYGVEPQGDAIETFAERRERARRQRMDRMIALCNERGMGVSLPQVRKIAGDHAMLTRPHLARALLASGYVGSIGEAFDRFLADGQPCHVEQTWPSVDEAIAIIHEAGGIAVLAHPGQYDLDDAIEGWVQAGLDGIEVAHPSHGSLAQARYERIAQRFGLLLTRSSDFHGFSHKRNANELGSVELPAEMWEALQEALQG